MSKADDGGPAFPATVQGWNDRLTSEQFGMSLRDWFACQLPSSAQQGSYHALAYLVAI